MGGVERGSVWLCVVMRGWGGWVGGVERGSVWLVCGAGSRCGNCKLYLTWKIRKRFFFFNNTDEWIWGVIKDILIIISEIRR